MARNIGSPVSSEYWAAIVEWSDEAVGRGRDVYIAPSAAELLKSVSDAVIGHYLHLFDARWGFIEMRGLQYQIEKFNGRHYDEHEWDSTDIAEEVQSLVEKDLESLQSETHTRSICKEWYTYCCDLQESLFGDTDYAFVTIEGPVQQFANDLMSQEREHLDLDGVANRTNPEWFDKLVMFASLPARAWNDETVFKDFCEHVDHIESWSEDASDDFECPNGMIDEEIKHKSETGVMTSPLEKSTETCEAWTRKIASLLARNRYADAFRLLDKVIEDDRPLFRGQAEELMGRRTAWLCRIDLLRERGRLAEALAWTCLECEINPTNITAQALKERLKRSLHLGSLVQNEGPPMPHLDSDGWEGVAGMRELKAILERDFILPLQEPELYQRYRVDVPNGVLFYGPPGCGKTYIARALAKKLDYTFFDITPSDLASPYVHGTQGKIGELFEKAVVEAPALIFFDELDALIPDRSGDHVGHHYSTEVNEFLVQLNECAKRRIAVIGATNFLRKVDPAARRPGRLDKHVFIGPPDVEARQEALRLFMKDRPQSNIEWFAIAEQADEYSFAELKFVVDEAARSALSNRRPITTNDLVAVLEHNPPQPKMTAEDYH